jgi:hypothetical protein
VGRIDPGDREPLAELTARYRALASQLAEIGFVARGSIISATTTCSSKGCHCRVEPTRRHGPYWQWSRSGGGVTRTSRLSEQEARLYRAWIANRRRAEAILAELEALSAQAAELVLARQTAEAPGEPPRRARPG